MRRALVLVLIFILGSLVVVSTVATELYDGYALVTDAQGDFNFYCRGIPPGPLRTFACDVDIQGPPDGVQTLTETVIFAAVSYDDPVYSGFSTANFSLTSVFIESGRTNVGNVSFSENVVPMISLQNPGEATIVGTLTVNSTRAADGFVVRLGISTNVGVPILGGLVTVPAGVQQQLTWLG